MAGRVFGSLNFEETDAVIGRREAKRDRRVLAQYLSQQRDLAGRAGNGVSADSGSVPGTGARKVPRDMVRRDTANRPFIAWDGEGYDDADGTHHYMLFGASTGDEVQDRSLGTAQCLDLMLSVEERFPDTYHVIFAGNYDVNMILRDVPTARLRELKTKGHTRWEGYTIGYIKGKMFRVKRGNVSMTLYDVFTFFGCSFVKALEQYIGDDNEDITRIKSGKAQRSDFDYSQVGHVAEYFRTELRYLVRLCERLRSYLGEAGLIIAKWHGPGAVASAVLKSRGFKRMSLPERIDIASQYAYLGGRFEQFKVGTHEGSVYQYDIRSAYPAAIATLPRLSADWSCRDLFGVLLPEDVTDFALYRVEYEGNDIGAQPFGWRYRNGAVFYPHVHGGGWVWGVELKTALRYAGRGIRVSQELAMHDSGHRPFAWIAEMYERRDQWKREGRAAQLALKLAMNSIYGKLAQQVGWRMVEGVPRLPQFHQLEYAGYITAFARAQLFAAMKQNPAAVIACETDAVYSSVPLTLDEGYGLGQWEAQKFDGIVYVQSGMYFAKEGSEWKYRTRGFTRNDVSVDDVRTWLAGIWRDSDAMGSSLAISQTRFRTLGTSIGKDDWRKWVTSSREIRAGVPGGKREHVSALCSACREGSGSMADVMHDMVVARSLPGVDFTVESTKYPLEWLGDKASQWVGDNDDVWREEVYA